MCGGGSFWKWGRSGIGESGATERRGLQKLCLAFPVASRGPMNARSRSWGAASVFSFCSVCFLFRSTAQFWFGPPRADGVWQVRISGATHLCLLEGCGLGCRQPLQQQEASLHSWIAGSFLSYFLPSLFTFLLNFFLLSFSCHLAPSPLTRVSPDLSSAFPLFFCSIVLSV